MRSTDDLSPEQRPSAAPRRRRRKLRGRTQPYRPVDRPPGPTLDAMLRGRPTYLPNPIETQREIERMMRRG